MIKIRVGFIGAGNMSQALVQGLLDSEGILSAQLVATDPNPEASSVLAEHGVGIVGSLDKLVENCELVILAVKPQVSEEVLSQISPFLTPEKVVLSLMAGVTTVKIESFLSKGSVVVRCMPQTLVRLRMGSCAICAGSNATISDLEAIQELLELVGEVVTVRESQMDAVTGLSGSGPAFVYSMIESLAAGGVREGLTKEVALKLAAQTMLGSSRMVLDSDLSPSQLKEQVTSPGGTTIAGLQVIERNNIYGILRNAVTAATQRSRELGNS
jgi:pyrroline-5-carboxylate reductase